MDGLLAIPEKHHFLLPGLLLPALLVCVLAPLILLRRSSSKLRLPPGPRGLPFIGHLHLLGSNPHHSLSSLTSSYGPLIHLRFGSVPVVVASSPSIARLILQAHDQTFAFRMQTAVPVHLHGCTDVLFSQPGPYWKLMRRICATDLFGRKRLESFRPLIAEEVHALLHSVLDKADAVPVRENLYRATNNIISRMALGKTWVDLETQSGEDPSYNLVGLLVEVIRLLGIFNVGDFIPSIAWMDLQGCVRRSKEVAQKLHIVLQEVIDGRRELRRQISSNNIASKELDFLDVLITASERGDVKINDSNIMAILMDIFGAGTDTSSITTEWALAELFANPIKLKRVQDELESVVGLSRLVHETDISHLPYLHAVIKETMRLHPVLPLLVPHKASQECNIAGYHIPSGTLAYVNVWAIGRDASLWERPLEFIPERFLECDTDVRGQHFELLPFGSGRRVCPGLVLGLTNVQYMLASLLHAYNWSSTEKPNMAEKFGIVMTLENPLVAKATPRVSKALLE